jgi:predicted amidohydrolase
MYLVLGMTTFQSHRARNTVRLVTPDGALRKPYHKRALYGWDETHYVPGAAAGGVHLVDGVRIGLRICYEVRFPEYFRELFRRRVQLAVVSFADVGPHKDKYDVVLAHLVSRAAENAMYVLSANSVSGPQVAPTCLVDPDGRLLARAPRTGEALITKTISIDPPNFGRIGRIKLSSKLVSEPT